MGGALPKLMALGAAVLWCAAADSAHPASEDIGNRFRHHGVATPVSTHRGTVATADGEGRDVL
ncbi:MAG: hypothetical protein QHJ73_19475, partial [Armatimonadota bacterium]|nr:hypothetical protein [Armatimonadota bacterium]